MEGEIMGKPSFTEAQKKAIYTTDKTLLVSAAAGSGKTATLTERIITSIVREENPISVTSLLVVTFTNAAAGELRERIAKALADAISERPRDARLERELRLLPGASISTIDSFCTDVLRQNAERVGISPKFRVADEAEARLMLESLLEALIYALYNGERPEVASPEEFFELSEVLTDSKSTGKLYEIFELIYEKLTSTESGVDSLLPLVQIYEREADMPPEDSRYGKYIMDMLHSYAEHYIKIADRALDDFSVCAPEPKLLELVLRDKAGLEGLRDTMGYSEAKTRLEELTYLKKPRVDSDAECIEEYFAARDDMKDEARLILSKFFSYSLAEWQELYKSLHKTFGVFYRVLKEFDTVFRAEKRRRGICQYSDIERYAYECLWDGDEPSEVAIALKEKYEAVYIDEYQDVNNLQNKIFEAISRPNNRFMVGDIKQSIYGFRSARPEIFAEMKSTYPPLDDAENSEAAALFMSKNFRSNRRVIDFINAVFDKAFGVFGESIGYVWEDRLEFGKGTGDGSPIPEVTVFDKAESVLEEDGEQTRAEPIFVAEKIKELLSGELLDSGRPIRPSDIAIVLRSVRGRGSLYSEALSSLGIPSAVVESKSFFLNGEVLLVLCLLNSIDNPKRDVYLAGLMRSPLFSFTPDELLAMRRAGGDTLYDSLVIYTEQNPDYTHGAEFLEKLNSYRRIAEGVSVHTLISRLYRELGLLSLAKSGEGRENLVLLYNYARRFEGTDYKGLYSFINYINTVINRGARFDDSHEEGDTDAVKIVTVHGSKGLEYPVVFYSDTGKSISNKDASGRVAYAEDFGIAAYLRSKDGTAIVKNPIKEVVNSYLSRKNFEEELRILYVALTRARERLYITGEASKERTAFLRSLRTEALALDGYSATRVRSHLATVLLAELDGIATVAESSQDSDVAENADGADEVSAVQLPDIPEEQIGELRDELIRRFSFEYPGKFLTEVPEKLSVSALYPEVLDESDEHSMKLDTGEVKRTDKSPRFKEGLTGAELSARRGIATHQYLQFCDLEALSSRGAVQELSRMVKDGFLSKEDAELVRLEEIELFINSELYRRMRSAKKIWRELRFNIRLPASRFTASRQRSLALAEKTVLVQGVIDCVILGEDDEIYLIDYKTDRLSREELSDRRLAALSLSARHAEQLGYYYTATERMFSRPPKKTEVYSMHLGDTVEIEIEKNR